MAKKTKAEADYGKAKAGGDRCQACKWFEVERPNGCELVDGRIEPDGWCKFWHGKSDTRMRRQTDSARLLKYGRHGTQ